MSNLLQFIFSGFTMGAVYALVAIGFVLIYSASGVINFAQGEFVMLGGMIMVVMIRLGFSLLPAGIVAIGITAAFGLALYWLAIRPAKGASAVTLVIITIGASIFIKGATSVVFGKDIHSTPDFIGAQNLVIHGASIRPQSLLVLAGMAVIVLLLSLFFTRTLSGKAIVATAADNLAARLAGINTSLTIGACFVVSAAIGAIGGVLITPLAMTSYDIGATLALKGFAAAVLGGLGNPVGAVAGGLILGLLEALGAGYISSLYKDAIAFIVLLIVLMFMPLGLFGRASVERV